MFSVYILLLGAHSQIKSESYSLKLRYYKMNTMFWRYFYLVLHVMQFIAKSIKLLFIRVNVCLTLNSDLDLEIVL